MEAETADNDDDGDDQIQQLITTFLIITVNLSSIYRNTLHITFMQSLYIDYGVYGWVEFQR